MLCLHPRRVVVTANSDTDDARLPQPLERLGDERPVAIGGGLRVEEVAKLGKNARAMGDRIVYGGAKCLGEACAALLAALGSQSWQARREVVVACDDDSRRRCG
jgi:hypothetical protein